MSLPIRARLTAWYARAARGHHRRARRVRRPAAARRPARHVDRELRHSRRPASPSATRAEGAPRTSPTSRDSVLPRRARAAQVLDPAGGVLRYWAIAGRRQPIASPDACAPRAAPATRASSPSSSGADGRASARRRRPVDRLGAAAACSSSPSRSQPVEDSVQRRARAAAARRPGRARRDGAGGWWLARKALRPVERMTSKAREIGIDRLDERIAVPPAADELAHLAVTLNAMLDRLERGVREKHRLVADASHELRTPLAVMRAELDVSLRDDDLAAGGARGAGERARGGRPDEPDGRQPARRWRRPTRAGSSCSRRARRCATRHRGRGPRRCGRWPRPAARSCGVDGRRRIAAQADPQRAATRR